MSEKELQTEGNVAVRPKIQEEVVKEPKKKQSHKKKQKPKRELKTKDRAYTIGTILLIFILGFGTVLTSSRVMLLKKNYNEKAAELSALQRENEDLNIKLFKFDNEDYIEGIATGELGMRKAKAEEYVSVDLSKDNFNSEETKEKKGKLETFIDYILGR